MKRTSPSSGRQKEIKSLMNRVDSLSSMVSRAQLAGALGQSYGGDRDIYSALGYKKELTYNDFVLMYSRLGTAKRANNAPCDSVWCNPPAVYDVGDNEQSAFEAGWQKFAKRHRVWHKFNQADKLLGFDRYSVLIFGFNDVDSIQDQQYEVIPSANLDLLWIRPYAAAFATIEYLDQDPSSPRYGLPYQYRVRAQAGSNTSQDFLVHHSRIIHVLEGNLDNDVYGEPRLQNVFNRLQDLDKILGGSGEMFWRGAKPGYVANLQIGDDGHQWDEDDPSLSDMREQLEEYEHNLRRWLTMSGVDVKSLDVQVSDPSQHVDVQLQDISASTGIPKRLLTGSERGELASSQDRANWDDVIDRRRNWFAEPIIIYPFIERMNKLGILEEPAEGEFYVDWPSLRDASDKEKADIGKVRADALKSYLSIPGSQMVLPADSFLRLCLGLDEDEIRRTQTQVAGEIAEEESEIAEDESATSPQEEREEE